MKKVFAIAFIAAATLVACNDSGEKKPAADSPVAAPVDTTKPAVDTTKPVVDTTKAADTTKPKM